MSCAAKELAKTLFEPYTPDSVREMTWRTIEANAKCLNFEVDSEKCRDCPMYEDEEKEKKATRKCPECGAEMELVSAWRVMGPDYGGIMSFETVAEKWRCKKCGYEVTIIT